MRLKSLLTAAACFFTLAAAAQAQEQCPAARISLIRPGDGGRVDWRPDGRAIAADRRNPSTGCYDVYELDTAGRDLDCVTCNKASMPRHNKGNPAYYPDGKYLIFQAEKESHIGKACGFYTNPGSGLFNDLWGVNLTTGRAALLYAPPESLNAGVLHPHFSHDGSKLLWSEMYHMSGFSAPYKAGRWMLRMADVTRSADGDLALRNIRTLLPTKDSGEGLVESHGFTPDDRHIVFSGNLGYKDLIWKHNDIFIADLDGGNRQNLTQGSYNEHGHFSPSGRTLAWMSSRWSSSGNEQDGTELYVQHGGQAVCQVSHFNTAGYPESRPGVTNAADISWSPDGTRFAAYSHNRDFKHLEEDIWLVSFGSAQ